ncbi:8440_t:CDS:2, partial [Acaulospora morrowiae]
GFGNLAGTMDVWDRKTLEKTATIEAQNSSESFWSPDGRYIMTATLSPRLRVDNGYKIWHYTGVLVHTTNIQELLQVQWRPANADLYPMRTTLSPPPKISNDLTASDVKPLPKKVGAYRPPHARGKATPEIFKREDESSKNSSQDHGTNKSAGTTENLSKVASRNKRKRELAKKKKESSSTTVNESTEIPTNVQSVIINNGAQVDKDDKTKSESIPEATSSLSENDKKIRNLTKKLRQIEELKERQQSGDKLEQTQLQKIANEASLRKELEMLRL